jgi:hypothetical protein
MTNEMVLIGLLIVLNICSFIWLVILKLEIRKNLEWQEESLRREMPILRHNMMEVFARIEAAMRRRQEKEMGRIQQQQINAKIAQKMADRAFQMANAASLGVLALQRSLPRAKLITKDYLQKAALARKKVDEAFSPEPMSDWLRPVLTPEELDVLEKAEEHFAVFDDGSK